MALTAAHLVTMTAAIALIGTACASRSERNVLIMTGVVLHLTARSTRKHRAVLRNALNLVPEVAPGTPIEMVVHGEAILLALPGQETAEALTEAIGAGIVLVVCRNSMRSQNLEDDDLIQGAVVASSGVGHLVARQTQGWAYLRP